MKSQRRNLLSLAVLLAFAGGAQAMSNNSAPSNWRFDSNSTFNGVNFDGVARIIMDNSYVCSGTLLKGGTHVLTAAHCVDSFSDFQIDFGLNNDVAKATRGAAATYTLPGWGGFGNSALTGQDVAIIKLDAKVEGIQGFKLHKGSAVGQSVLMMGYGTTTQGNTATAPNWGDWGHGHWGMNTYDVTSKVFLDAWAAEGPGDNTYGEEYVADYDSGTQGNNTLGIIAGMTGNLWNSGTGGQVESLITGGDSGGGDFVWNGSEWLVTGVHSWGWQFCQGRINPSCDFSTANSGSWGDLMGSTAVYRQVDWINSVVPEPGTYALMALGLLGVGLASRRRRAG